MTGPEEVTVVPKRIGGSIAIFLPAELVRRESIREGIPIRVSIHPEPRASVLGLLKRKGPHEPFDRHKEGFWPDD